MVGLIIKTPNKKENLMCKENGKQYKGIDLLKFIMAVFVIMAHTNPFVNIKSELFINRLFRQYSGKGVKMV
jgi:peptidoglycan/LPS O-acetylase OafA/YrhL